MGLATGLSMAATGLSAGSSILGGFDKASSIRQQAQQEAVGQMYQAGQLEVAAAIGDLRATQTDTALRQRTTDALGNIDAVLALTGTTDNSPSSWAVKNRFEGQSDMARNQAVWNLHMDAESKRNTAALYMLGAGNAIQSAGVAANDAEINGFLGGAGNLLKGLSGMKWSF